MKRIVLFLLTNLAVGLVLSVTLSLLGANQILAGTGLNIPMLVVFSIVVGFGGSLISLAISKPVAKMVTGARALDPPQGAPEQWLGSPGKPPPANAGAGVPAAPPSGGAPNASPPR